MARTGRTGTRGRQEPKPSDKACAHYERLHWGKGPSSYYVVPDKSLPKEMVAIGHLVECVVDTESGKDGAEFDLTFGKRCLLAFDAADNWRMWMVLAKEDQKWIREDLWGLEAPLYDLREVARAAGGCWSRRLKTCPKVKVKVVGRMTEVVYKTEKVGDGVSSYVHHMGERGGIAPYLCVTSGGKIHIAGGSYRLTTHGIEL